ncbi:MAG: Trk system potassium transporter TrkA [Bacteroides sp.]|nr:Trk system potassium transporter TrkA [Prevotella sp.]MCM1408832.1 Trk system potassium transporter TrkA [Treponema brennaborense]MCM1470612.1 Trk system potassium transporter TrkA [Bacteroides sp.]
MKTIIVGAGFTGVQLARRLIADKNDVVLIDSDEETVRHVSNRLDCMVMQANGNSLRVLEDAGIEKADSLVAVTNSDEVNMITCSLVDSVYPKVKKIARVRNYDYYANSADSAEKEKSDASAKNSHHLYGIDNMVHPDVEAAEAIVNAVEHGAVTEVVDFENSEYELTRITVEKGSRLDGVCVQDIRRMTDDVFLLAFVEKGNETYMPDGSAVLHAEDRIGILTTKEALPRFLELCGSEIHELKKIILVGAGRIGTLIADQIVRKNKLSFLSRFLGFYKKANQEFVIIDNDSARAKAASERYPEAAVFCADITDESFIAEEGLDKFDLLITATHNYELNMVTAAYFKSLGMERTVCLVASSSFAGISRNIGIDVAVPIKDAVVDTIISHLRGKNVSDIHTVSDAGLEIAEIELPETTKVAGKTLKDIAVAGSFLVLLICKAETNTYVLADGNTSLSPFDKLVVIDRIAENRKLLDILGVLE